MERRTADGGSQDSGEPRDTAKRRAITAAARALFLSAGYGAVSMDQIARAAEVSKATLYAHFESKDALFAAIIQERCAAMVALTEAPPDDADPVQVITGLAKQLALHMASPESIALHRVIITERGRFPEIGRIWYERGVTHVLGIFADTLRRLDAAGRLPVPDPAQSAEYLAALVKTSWFIRMMIGQTDPADLEAEIDAAIRRSVAFFVAAHRGGAG